VHGFALNAVLNGRDTASAMAPQLGMTKQGAARVISHLLEEGYVEYVDADADARSKPVALTARGEDVVALSVRTQARIEAEWTRLGGPGEMAAARRVLQEAVSHDRDEPPAVRIGW
jgi:DNA-binding MarR family transcriptional regulator